MIHYNYIDPADAEPGDFMLISMYLHFDLSVCVSMPGYGNTWQFINQFEHAKCSDEIVDGKPTPALIARYRNE